MAQDGCCITTKLHIRQYTKEKLERNRERKTLVRLKTLLCKVQWQTTVCTKEFKQIHSPTMRQVGGVNSTYQVEALSPKYRYSNFLELSCARHRFSLSVRLMSNGYNYDQSNRQNSAVAPEYTYLFSLRTLLFIN